MIHKCINQKKNGFIILETYDDNVLKFYVLQMIGLRTLNSGYFIVGFYTITTSGYYPTIKNTVFIISKDNLIWLDVYLYIIDIDNV